MVGPNAENPQTDNESDLGPSDRDRDTVRAFVVTGDPDVRKVAEAAGFRVVGVGKDGPSAELESGSDPIDLLVVDPDSDAPAPHHAPRAEPLDLPIVWLGPTPEPRRWRGSLEECIAKQDLTPQRLRRVGSELVERARSIAALRSREESLRAVVTNSINGVLVFDCHGLVQFANPAAARLIGRSADALVGGALPVALRDTGAFPRPAASGATVAGDWPDLIALPGSPHVEARLVDVTWEHQPAKAALLRDVSHHVAYHASLERVNRELKVANARLEQLARVDPLTDLLNRRGFEHVLREEFARATRSGARICAILVDCDDFKRINDEFGHDVGDCVLREVAARLRHGLRPSDRVARVGGDEFLMLLPDTRSIEAQRVAERLREVTAASPVEVGERSIEVTASLAVVSVDAGCHSLETILSSAHDDLRRSKESGKNRVSGGSANDGPSIGPGPIPLDVAMRVVSLPIYSLASGARHGFELLSRPMEIADSPSEVFRICRERRCVTEVDLHCLACCARAARRLPGSGAIHVNLFPETLLRVGADAVVTYLATGLDIGRFCIELSEQQVDADVPRLRSEVLALHSQGVRVAIDDIGFGRDSLEALILLEPDVVKVARRYVEGIAGDGGKRRAMSRMVSIAGSLDIALIAEGIGCADDLSALRELGVGLGQGFYWGKPRPVGEPDSRGDELLAQSTPG